MIKKKIKKAKEGKGRHKAIGERNRIALAFMELARDKAFQKLGEEQKLKLIKDKKYYHSEYLFLRFGF